MGPSRDAETQTTAPGQGWRHIRYARLRKRPAVLVSLGPVSRKGSRSYTHFTEQERKQAMSYRAIAQEFGDCITNRDYGAACALLTKQLQGSTTPERICNAVSTMTSYAPGPIQEAQVMDDFTLEDWPGKQAGDLAVVYVALNGDSFSEAVTLTLMKQGEDILIRELAWGRP